MADVFPEKCLISEESRKTFSKVAAEMGLSLSMLCAYRGRGECCGHEICEKVPDVEPFRKIGQRSRTSGRYLP
jgi:hypothetical protein